jgi:hypothetical protein
VLWAQIIGGDDQGYWVPVSFLAGLAPGKAHSLVQCSDWRWQLQQLF